MKKRINDITPEEWNSMNRDEIISKSFGGEQILNNPSLKAGAYAQFDARDALDMVRSLKKEHSDGSSADYYTFPKDFSELQDLISYKNMNAQIGEIFRACYRYGEVSHSPPLRDIKKILFYAKAELKRLENLNAHD